MNPLHFCASVLAAIASLSFATPACAQEVPKPKGVALLKEQAAKLAPLARSQLARDFLAATNSLPERATRTVYRNKDKNTAITAEAFNALPESDRAGYTPRECDENFYYQTGYGSPLVYARPLDIAAAHGFESAGGKYILDFGYGTIGHLRLLASLGARAHGVDAEVASCMADVAASWKLPAQAGRVPTQVSYPLLVAPPTALRGQRPLRLPPPAAP